LARYIDSETGATIEYNPPPIIAPVRTLQDVFKGAPETTLKLQVRESMSLDVAVETAFCYVCDPKQKHSRIEFKFNNCYIVVARLKEKMTWKEER